MAFKDYENLDASKEVVSEKELKKLEKKYGVEEGHYYKVGVRRSLTCIAIAIIFTIIVMLLYSNIIVIDFTTKILFSMIYFVMFFCIISEIYIIFLKKKNIKMDIFLLLYLIDVIILVTSFIIGLMAPVSSIVKTILLIIVMITFVAFIPSMVILKALENNSK